MKFIHTEQLFTQCHVYLLKHAKEKEEKIFLLNYFLDQFKGTVFRQTMFAEFEKRIHEKMAEEGTLTADGISELYLSINKEYFGPDMISDPQIALEWARIPHFYTPFYVYQYATGFSAAIAISSKILEILSTADIIAALKKGVEGAYKAVMKPTEGTILTVARVASEEAAASDAADVPALWDVVLTAGQKALEDTPNLLPVLKKAGVVDAGTISATSASFLPSKALEKPRNSRLVITPELPRAPRSMAEAALLLASTHRVKDEVEHATGLKVARIDVFVDDIIDE